MSRQGNSVALDVALAQVAAIGRLCAEGNPWPGWSLTGQPAMLALSGGGNIVLGLPEPPPGFRPIEIPAVDPGPGRTAPRQVAAYRPGYLPATPLVQGTLAGEYRSIALGDHVLPVVAAGEPGKDPLVNLGVLARNLFRVQVAAQMAADLDVQAGFGGDDLEELLQNAADSLAAQNPRARLAAFLFESQKAFEHYPETSLLNNVLANLEGRLLYGHISANGFAADLAKITGDPPSEALARAFALARRERYGEMSATLVAYERRMEVYEGLPRYVEISLFRLLGDQAGGDDTGSELQVRARRLVATRLGLLTQLNQRGWGASRRRFYHSGMALGFLLDGTVPGWRQDIAAEHTPLDRILESVVSFDGGNEDERILETARQYYGYFERLEDERSWTRDVDGRRRELLEGLFETAGTRVSVDVSALTERSTWYDADTVERIGESLLVHVRPGVFTYGDGGTFVEFRGVSIVEDKRAKMMHTNLPGPDPVLFGDDESLPLIKGVEFTEGLDVELGGLKIRARRGTVQRDGKVLLIKLLA